MTARKTINAYVCTTLARPLLRQCLASARLAARLVPECDVAIVVVANVSPNEQNLATVGEILRSQTDSEVRVLAIYEEEPGIPHARNRALNHAIEYRPDFIAFLDDDCVADPEWLASLINCHEHQGVEILAGGWRTEPHLGKPSRLLPKKIWGPKDYQVRGSRALPGERLPHAYTRSVLLSASIIESLDGVQFDTSRTQLGGSDVLFFNELVGRGAEIAYCPTSQVAELFSGERLQLRWHFWRRLRNIQFILERSIKLAEVIVLPRTIAGTLYGSILRAVGAIVTFRTPEKRKLKLFRPKPEHLGWVAFRCAQLLGVLGFALRIRHRNYRPIQK